MENISTNLPSLPPINSAPIISSPVQEPVIQVPIKNKNIIFYIICGTLILLLTLACFALAFKSQKIIDLILPKNKKTTSSVVYKTNKNPVISTSPTLVHTVTAPATSDKKVLSPKESYLIMKKEGDNLNTFDDYVAFVNKYGSKEQIIENNKNLSQVASMPSTVKEQIVSMVKAGTPLSKDITNIQESVTANTATLNISTNKPNLKGVVTLVLEEGVWKMDKESWEEK